MEAAQVTEPASDDRDVLLAAREGSEDAGRRLMRDHGPGMLRTARHVLGRWSGNDAEDAVQEAFIAALTTDALPHGDVGAWMRSIAARKALDAARSRSRRAEDELADGPVPVPSDLDVLAVRQALSRLSAADRAVLVLVDLEGRSMAEAAQALGTTNVGTRLRAVRARRKLAKLLREGGAS
jgi:RNA polymerase sigma-70 factor (ECF subfamily)